MVLQSWDIATKDGEHSDYSVCTTWLYQDKRYYLVDDVRDRMDYPTLKARACSLERLYQPKIILIEDAGLGTALAKELKDAGLPTIAVKPGFDKRTRMSIQSTKFESGQVFLPIVASWLDDLEAELFSFPGGRYDDQVDSISQALAHEMPSMLFTDQAIKGYANLTQGLLFDRYFGRW
jgi:predicted phage terminase large subunit-like protein